MALIVAAALLVLVIACANAAGMQLRRVRPHARWSSACDCRWARAGAPRTATPDRERADRHPGRSDGPAHHLGADACGGHDSDRTAPAEYTLVVYVTPDLSVFLYILGLSLTTGLVFGVAPALANTRDALFAVRLGPGTQRGAAGCVTVSSPRKSPSC